METEILDGSEPIAASTKEKVTTKYMTKYERARILGTRALQIRYLARTVVRPPARLLARCPGLGGGMEVLVLPRYHSVLGRASARRGPRK